MLGPWGLGSIILARPGHETSIDGRFKKGSDPPSPPWILYVQSPLFLHLYQIPPVSTSGSQAIAILIGRPLQSAQ